MNEDEIINTSIDEYLISLANSVNHAQRYISELRVPGQEGQPTISYQLPRVDFELKMQFQLSKDAPPSGGGQRDVAKSEGGGYLEARPIGGENGDRRASELASTIKGSFVAVPVHGGNAPPIINVSWSRAGDQTFKITVTAQEAGSNDPLGNRTVQFNIDRDLMAALNSEANSIPSIKGLSTSVAQTDARGQATSTLAMSDAKDIKVPVIIDVLGRTETLIFDHGDG